MYQVCLKSLDINWSYRSEKKVWTSIRQITPSKFDEIRPLAIPNQISTISMHTPSLVKIHWCLLKLSSGNEIRTDVKLTDWQMDRHTAIIPPTIMWRGIKRFNPVPLQPRFALFANSVDPDQMASSEANWPESALLVIKYVTLYNQPGSCNLIDSK